MQGSLAAGESMNLQICWDCFTAQTLSLLTCHSDQQQGGVTAFLLISWQGLASWNLINKSIVSNRNNCKDVVCGSTSYHCCGNATRHVIRLGNCCSNSKIYSMSPTEGVVMGERHTDTQSLQKCLSKASAIFQSAKEAMEVTGEVPCTILVYLL